MYSNSSRPSTRSNAHGGWLMPLACEASLSCRIGVKVDACFMQVQHHLGQQQQHHQQQQDALAKLRGAWRRVSPAVEELMSSVAPEGPAPASPEASVLSLPW